MDYGESLEEAALREAKEETNLDVKLIRQFHTYSDPKRDPRHHSISTAYIAKAKGIPKAKDDALEIGIFNKRTYLMRLRLTTVSSLMITSSQSINYSLLAAISTPCVP